MVTVIEFKSIEELNNYTHDKLLLNARVIPVSVLFENPKTKLLTNTIRYILVMN